MHHITNAALAIVQHSSNPSLTHNTQWWKHYQSASWCLGGRHASETTTVKIKFRLRLIPFPTSESHIVTVKEICLNCSIAGTDGETRYSINNGAWSPRPYDRVRQACCSQGWWRGHETETCQTGRWERQAKGWERIGDSEQCVYIYAMLIFLTFHGESCFAVTVTDREEGRIWVYHRLQDRHTLVPNVPTLTCHQCHTNK